jgi:hypothetical protein
VDMAFSIPNNAAPNFFSTKTAFPGIPMAQCNPPSAECRTATFRTTTRGNPISVLSALGNRGFYPRCAAWSVVQLYAACCIYSPPYTVALLLKQLRAMGCSLHATEALARVALVRWLHSVVQMRRVAALIE